MSAGNTRVGWGRAASAVDGDRVLGVDRRGDQLDHLAGSVDAIGGQLLSVDEQLVEGDSPVRDDGVAAQNLGGVGDERGEAQAGRRFAGGSIASGSSTSTTSPRLG